MECRVVRPGRSPRRRAGLWRVVAAAGCEHGPSGAGRPWPGRGPGPRGGPRPASRPHRPPGWRPPAWGKAGYLCQGDQPVLHGPYLTWTRTVAGKTVTRKISEDQQAHYQAWFDNARRLHQLVTDLETLSLRAFDQAGVPGPGAENPTDMWARSAGIITPHALHRPSLAGSHDVPPPPRA